METALFRKIQRGDLTKGERSRVLILESVIKTIGREGWPGFTYDKIAQEIDFKKALVAYHFPEKEELLRSTFQYTFLLGQEYVLAALQDSGSDALELLQSYVIASHNWLFEHPDHGAMLSLLSHRASVFHGKAWKQLGLDLEDFGRQRVRSLARSFAKWSEAQANQRGDFIYQILSARLLRMVASMPHSRRHQNAFSRQTWSLIFCVIEAAEI